MIAGLLAELWAARGPTGDLAAAGSAYWFGGLNFPRRSQSSPIRIRRASYSRASSASIMMYADAWSACDCSFESRDSSSASFWYSADLYGGTRTR